MSNEPSDNRDDVASKRDINLVVTGTGGVVGEEAETDEGDHTLLLSSPTPTPTLTKHAALANSAAQASSFSQGNPDPRRIMHELPADEFIKVLEQSTPEQLQTIISSFEKSPRNLNAPKWLQKIVGVPSGPRSLISTLFWWECRRPVYNLVVGLAGLPSILIFTLFGIGHNAVFAAMIYAILANICYSLGTPAELVARLFWREKADNYGPVLLTLGTIFSVLLTIFLQLLVCAVFILGFFSPRF